MNEYTRIQALIYEDPDEAVRKASELLDKNHEDALALFIVGTVYAKAERYGLAANIFKRICGLRPDRAEAWNNLGMSLSGMGVNVKARQAFQEAWKRQKTATFAANIGMTYLEQREHKKAVEWCNKALEIDPQSKAAKTTRGMCNLATGNWKQGWADNAHSLGNKFRKETQFKEEGRWDGSPGKNLVIYGEQGLGDEIMYASCVPDAQKVSASVMLECDKRLEGLFRRSFPGVHVYGTRRQNEVEWPARHEIDARVACGQLPEFFRHSPESCPGTPYLVADPERRLQWRALLDSLGPKPKIGIAWSGGSKHNNPAQRNAGLKAFKPLIDAIDADWISLQYKDPTKEIEESGLPVKHWKRACETDDYDDTAALVAELDCVIGVHTSVHHLAGALGVPGIILTHTGSPWIYALDVIPWYGSARLFKQREGEPWVKTIERLSNDPCIHWLRSPRGSGEPHIQQQPDPQLKRASHDLLAA